MAEQKTPTQICARCRHRLPMDKFSKGCSTYILLRPVCDACAAVENGYDQTQYPIYRGDPHITPEEANVFHQLGESLKRSDT